ncbi:hypothetical protein BHE74_00052537 [Ensete ventricosum]|nr:hypothetical protein GW17_00045639 [Ensete ventricosum]RWW41944.1 hypothetical protein BHE74_00052537 [Ensete ventricosum]
MVIMELPPELRLVRLNEEGFTDGRYRNSSLHAHEPRDELTGPIPSDAIQRRKIALTVNSCGRPQPGGTLTPSHVSVAGLPAPPFTLARVRGRRRKWNRSSHLHVEIFTFDVIHLMQKADMLYNSVRILRYHEREYLRSLFHDELASLFSQTPTDGAACISGGPSGPDTRAIFPAVTFTDVLLDSMMDNDALPREFGLSCSAPLDVHGSGGMTWSPELMAHVGNGSGSTTPAFGCGGSATPVTPNSSTSSLSAEAAGEDDADRCKKEEQQEEEVDTSKKV